MTLSRLPLFPLPLVLFPNAPQLLHIFEPRYREMLTDCLAGQRRFGLSFLAAPRSDRPEPGDVGCRARIEQFRQLPDGRSNVLAIGEERYVLHEIVFSETQYLVGAVEFFSDDDEDPPSHELANRVQRQFEIFVASWHEVHDFVAPPGEVPTNPTDLSFHVAANLETDPGAQEELLRLTSTRLRLERLLVLLEAENRERQRRVEKLRTAKGNGRGPHGPDIIEQ